MKKLPLVLVFAAALAATGTETRPGAAAPAPPPPPQTLELGATVPELSGAWSKGTPVSLAAQRGKNVVVFYFWSVNQGALVDIPRFAATVRSFQGKPVVFVGVGCDRVQRVTGFFRVRELPIPILIDDRFTTRRRFLPADYRLPAAAIVDKEGRLVWRGASAAVPSVLNRILSGSFDLKEHIRRQKFAEKVRAALAKSHFEEALELIGEELKLHPANVELVALQATIWARGLKKPDQALKAVDEALRHAPKEIAFLELKMKLLYGMHDESGLKRFYTELCRTLADKPLVLARFAAVEMGRPVVDQRPEYYCMLLTAAHESKSFKDDREHGVVELTYSRMLLMCGRPDLAIKAAKRAIELLAKAPELKEAEAMLAFYRRIDAAAKSLGR